MSSDGVDFCTLGMFILDDIYPAPSAYNQTPQLNVVGGAGTYSAIGARLFAPAPSAHAVGWVVDAGIDFPPEVRSLISSWDTGILLRQRDGLTTKGWNGYGEKDHRAFKYLTEKIRITADDLTHELLGSRSFHLICSASRCKELVLRILERRRAEVGMGTNRPIFIWEPVPDLCISSELELVKDTLRLIDVLSPNHEELGLLFGFSHSDVLDRAAVEGQMSHLLDSGIGPDNDGAIVVRAGKDGCFVASRNLKSKLPAFHRSQQSVIDPTGGGNGFLGGFAIGLVKTGDLIEAAAWGSVAASFCIEQVGPPCLSKSRSDSTCELWNNCSVSERLDQYHRQISRQSKDTNEEGQVT